VFIAIMHVVYVGVKEHAGKFSEFELALGNAKFF
jgi:hypothetical protein